MPVSKTRCEANTKKHGTQCENWGAEWSEVNRKMLCHLHHPDRRYRQQVAGKREARYRTHRLSSTSTVSGNPQPPRAWIGPSICRPALDSPKRIFRYPLALTVTPLYCSSMTKQLPPFTVREAAEYLGVSITQVWRLIRSGELRAVVNKSVFRSERVTLLSHMDVERRKAQRDKVAK